VASRALAEQKGAALLAEAQASAALLPACPPCGMGWIEAELSRPAGRVSRLCPPPAASSTSTRRSRRHPSVLVRSPGVDPSAHTHTHTRARSHADQSLSLSLGKPQALGRTVAAATLAPAIPWSAVAVGAAPGEAAGAAPGDGAPVATTSPTPDFEAFLAARTQLRATVRTHPHSRTHATHAQALSVAA
jgi:hypothetical protein